MGCRPPRIQDWERGRYPCQGRCAARCTLSREEVPGWGVSLGREIARRRAEQKGAGGGQVTSSYLKDKVSGKAGRWEGRNHWPEPGSHEKSCEPVFLPLVSPLGRWDKGR